MAQKPKVSKDIDLSKVFADEQSILNEAGDTKPRNNSLLNDNSHMRVAGKEGVDLKAGSQLSTKDVQNFTDATTFKMDDSRDNAIYFFCKACKYITSERPKEYKHGSYKFICAKCGERAVAWGTKTSIEHQFKVTIT